MRVCSRVRFWYAALDFRRLTWGRKADAVKGRNQCPVWTYNDTAYRPAECLERARLNCLADDRTDKIYSKTGTTPCAYACAACIPMRGLYLSPNIGVHCSLSRHTARQAHAMTSPALCCLTDSTSPRLHDVLDTLSRGKPGEVMALRSRRLWAELYSMTLLYWLFRLADIRIRRAGARCLQRYTGDGQFFRTAVHDAAHVRTARFCAPG